MTTEQKKKAVQAGTHLLENDGSIYEWNKAATLCSPYEHPVFASRKYFSINDGFVNLFDVNPHNLPTIKASTFFIDEPDEPMINISFKRLEELVKKAHDKENCWDGYSNGISTLHELLKLEAK